MHGVLLIDKEEGMSSFDVIRALKKKFSEQKIGHLGTLDPMATGLLVVFLGKATKLIPYFAALDKEYLVELELGKISDTYDRTGRIEVLPAVNISPARFEAGALSFLGNQWQIQPPFSAIRIQGKRAYELAREGKAVDLGKRQVTFESIDVMNYHAPMAEMRVSCSSGTYVRSLIHELGQKLHSGAIMTALRRTRVGKFQLEKAKNIADSSVSDLISPVNVVENYLERGTLAGKEYEYLLKRCQSLLDD